jgi:hypothetical protein
MPKREAMACPGEGGKSTFAGIAFGKGTSSDLDAPRLPAGARVHGDESDIGPGFGAG